MNKTLLSAAMIAGFGVAALVPQAANAASGGTITFSGSLVASTCAVVLNAGASATGTVTLPAVGLVDGTLSTVGSSAGWTAFTLNLSGCPATLKGPTGVAYTSVYPYFTAGNIDNTTGYLTNTGSVNSGVEVALSTSSTGGPPYLTLQDASGAQGAGTVALSTTASAFTFYAGYVVTALPVVAGTVTSTVVYNLMYQ